MKLGPAIVAFAAFVLLLPSAFAKDSAKDRDDKDATNDIKQAPKITYFQPEESVSRGSVTVAEMIPTEVLFTVEFGGAKFG